MRPILSASFALTALLATGCPSSSSAPIPIEDFGAEFGTAACDAVEACTGPTVSNIFFAPAGGCDAAFVASYRNALLPLVNQGVARGTITYSGTDARACVDALHADPCTLTNNGAAAVACQNVWQGNQPAGGACSLNEECGVDQFCTFDMACPGACQARRTSGQTCTEERACAPGLTCNGEGMCAAPPMVGVACEGLGGCSLGLLCSGGACRPSSEVLIANEGQACHLQMGPLCREGLSCTVDMIAAGGATYICRALAAPGGACRIGLPAQCPAGQACTETDLMRLDFDGICAPAPSTEGATCDAIAGCASGFRCTDNACVRVRENGDTCTAAGQCGSGVCTSGMCVAPRLCGS